MTLSQLRKHLRVYILRDVPHNVDWENIDEDSDGAFQLHWSNDELDEYINEAYVQACRNALLILDATTAAVTQISVSDGTGSYTLHSKILKVVQAKLAGRSEVLEEKSVLDVNKYSNWETDEGVPSYYILDYEKDKIRLYPIPSEDDTLNLIVKRLPLTKMSSDSDTPSDIREEYHRKLLHYAAYLAYQKDGPKTFDPDRSLAHLQIFEREFGDTSAYAETRKRRKRPRPIKYGGL